MTEKKIKNKKKIMTESLEIINQPDKRGCVEEVEEKSEQQLCPSLAK